MALPSLQIHKAILKEAKNADIYISDVDYSIPKREWVRGNFYRLYKSWLSRHGLHTWKSYHDCDNKAETFSTFASFCHAKTMTAREREGKETYQGIAVGVVYYLIGGNKNKGHAINIIYTQNGIEFLEPQNGRFQNLTQKEKDSIWFVSI